MIESILKIDGVYVIGDIYGKDLDLMVSSVDLIFAILKHARSIVVKRSRFSPVRCRIKDIDVDISIGDRFEQELVHPYSLDYELRIARLKQHGFENANTVNSIVKKIQDKGYSIEGNLEFLPSLGIMHDKMALRNIEVFNVFSEILRCQDGALTIQIPDGATQGWPT